MMQTLENKLNAVLWYCVAQEDGERAHAREIMLDLLGKPAAPVRRDRDRGREIRHQLLELGVPDHLKGHGHLVTAVTLVCQEPRLITAITTELYPAVANLHGETPSRVERAIRHAIEVCWERGDLDVLRAVFGNTVSASRGKPTNGEFIARLANLLR
jgi:two-component system response regulator (stage 0 sporulation protein A)